MFVSDVIPDVLDGFGYPFEPWSSYSSIGGFHGTILSSGSGPNVTCFAGCRFGICLVLTSCFILLFR